MAVEKTIQLRIETDQALTGLKKVRGEIDITYAELRRTTPIELDGSQAKNALKDVGKGLKDVNKEADKLGKQGDKNIKALGTGLKDVNKESDKLGKQGTKNIKAVGTSADTSSGFFDKLKISTKGFGLALKATGIGLIVAALVKMKEALGKNQAVMDAVNVVMETINITLQKFINNIVKAFTNPQETIKKFGETIQSYVVDYVKGAIESIGLFGKAISKVFKGEFSEAGEIAKEGVKTLWNTNPIVKANKAVMDYNKSMKDAVIENNKSAKSLVKLRKEVKLAEAEQRLLQMTYQKDAEVQRQVRDDISLTMDERIAANEKLGQILEEQFQEEQKVAEKKLELAELELEKNKENVDLQVAVTNAKTEMADLDERITGQRSEQLINLIALQNEQTEAIKATAAERAKANQEYTDKILNRNMSAQEKEIQGVKDNFQEKYDILQEQYDAEEILQGEFLRIKGELETEEAQKIKAINDAVIQEQLDKEMDLYGGEMRETLIQAAERANFDMSEVRRDGARKEGVWTNQELKDFIDRKNIEVEITELTEEQKGQIIASALGSVADLVGKESKTGKALAIGQALINTYLGATKAIGQGGIFGPIAAAGVIATGMKSVKDIISTKLPGGDGGGGASVTSGGGIRSGEVNIPNVENIGTTELGQDTPVAPVQAYVVENDISSSQALQEELETQATL